MTLVEDRDQAEILGKLNGVPLNRCAGGLGGEHNRGRSGFLWKGGLCRQGQSGCHRSVLSERHAGSGVDVPTKSSAAGQTGNCAVLITEDVSEPCSPTLACRLH